MSRTQTLAVVAIAVLLAVGACGGDDEGISTATTATDPIATTTTTAGGASSTVPAAESTLPDPCSLLTDPEVAEGTGVTPTSHEPRYGTNCVWIGTGDMVNLAVAAHKIFMSEDNTPLAGFGDEAFVSYGMSGDPDYIVARKGAVWIQVEAYFLPDGTDEFEAMKQLTTSALAHLP